MSLEYPVDHRIRVRAVVCPLLFGATWLGFGTSARSAEPNSTGAVAVPRVSVTESTTAESPDASEGQGYRTERADTVGPWGPRPITDTPYSINVVSSDLLDNTLSSNVDQVFAHNPLVQLNFSQAAGYGSMVYIRGVRLDSLGSGFTRFDGKRVTGDLIVPIEDKERVEVLSGLSGFLYGSGNAGGLVNYVLKRPTSSPLCDLTIGNYGGGEYFAHADLGGPIAGDGRFGYRLNGVVSQGNTATDFNHVSKWLSSGAFDWHITDQLLAQVSFSHQHYYERGTGADWGTFGGSFPHFSPDLLDPDRNYGQTWSFNRNDMDTGGINVTYDVSSNLKVRLSYQKVAISDEQVYTGNNVDFENGIYTYDLAVVRQPPKRHSNDGGYAFVDYSFETGPLRQQITAGFFGDHYRLRRHQDGFEFQDLGVFDVMSTPQYVPVPTFTSGVLPFFTAQTTTNRNWVVGDDLRFGEHWSALLGVTHAQIVTDNFNTDATSASHYDKSVTSPSVSLLYKIVPNATVYATYIKSLESSGTAPDTFNGSPVTNANQALEPTVSRQYEVGIKIKAGESLLTAALFDIHRANTYYAALDGGAEYIYTNDGETRVRGLELTSTGRVTEHLTIVAGAELLDPKVIKTNEDYLQDQTPYGAAKRMVKLYAEYELPFVPKLTLVGGGSYVGGQLANNYAFPDPLGRDFLPSFTTWDLGARYRFELAGAGFTARVLATNLANKSYWQQAEQLGAPRSIAFSLSARFL